MRKPNYYICRRCDNEIYGDEKLYDLSDFGLDLVCKECFVDYVKDHKLLPENIIDEDGWSGDLLADHLDIDVTTAESHIDNEYDLMLEAKEEERREENILRKYNNF